MAKPKKPLFSFEAQGGLGDAIAMRHSRGQSIAEKKPIPTDVKSLAQLSWRHMYQKAVALWHALSGAEQQEWESSARRKHMTGFAWFMSQALKPNPGLYLPLQGGIMAGDIDMAKHRLLRLPLPSDSQEPLTLAYFTANIAPYLYAEGARVWYDVAQAVPHNTNTYLTFRQELYDTDNIHTWPANPSRLTCNTAGKYLVIGSGAWLGNATGYRRVWLLRNGTITEVVEEESIVGPAAFYMSFSVILHLALTDYLEFGVRQTSGGALTFGGTAFIHQQFMMQRIGN